MVRELPRALQVLPRQRQVRLHGRRGRAARRAGVRRRARADGRPARPARGVVGRDAAAASWPASCCETTRRPRCCGRTRGSSCARTIAPLNRDLDAYGNCIPEQRRISVSDSGIRDDAGAALGGRHQRGRAGLVRAQPVQRDARRAAAVGAQLRAHGRRASRSGPRASTSPPARSDQVLAPEGHETKLWEPQTGHEHKYDGLIVAMGVDAHATVAATQASTVAGLARGLDVAARADDARADRLRDRRRGRRLARRRRARRLRRRRSETAGFDERTVPAHVGMAA